MSHDCHVLLLQNAPIIVLFWASYQPQLHGS